MVFSFNRAPKELAWKDFPFGDDEDASSGGERASGRSPPEIAGQDCSRNQVKRGDFLWVAVKRFVGKDEGNALGSYALRYGPWPKAMITVRATSDYDLRPNKT